MSADQIQQARDVLAKWRKAATKLPWERVYSDMGTVRQESTGYSVGDNIDDDDARLIAGTAGNDALLVELDSLFATAQSEELRAIGLGPLLYDVDRIAAAIISADERMSA